MSNSELTQPQTQAESAHRKPDEALYFTIFLALAALTLTELAVTYIPIVKIPLLLGLAMTKAWLVIQFYMHLRYDNRLFTWTILIPVAIGALLTILIQPLVTIVR